MAALCNCETGRDSGIHEDLKISRHSFDRDYLSEECRLFYYSVSVSAGSTFGTSSILARFTSFF